MSRSNLPYPERVLRRLTPGAIFHAFGLGFLAGGGFVAYILPLITK